MRKTVLAILFAFVCLPLCAQELTERHVFSMNLGYAFKMGDTHSAQFENMVTNEDHASAMKHGYELEFNYDYRFHPMFAVGFKASMFGSVHGFDVEGVSMSGQPEMKYYSDDMNIFYVGPSAKFQLPTIAERFDIWARGTFGYLNMRNTDKTLAAATYSGSSFGWGLGFGVDYSINRYISVGLAASYLSGTVSTLHIGEDEIDISETPESLDRFNINFGVRIKL